MKIEVYDKQGNKIGEARSITVEREMRRHVFGDGEVVHEFWGSPPSISVELKDIVLFIRDSFLAMAVDVKISEHHTEDLWFKDCYVMEYSREAAEVTGIYETGYGIEISRAKLAVRETNHHFGDFPAGKTGRLHYDSAKTEAWLERWHRR